MDLKIYIKGKHGLLSWGHFQLEAGGSIMQRPFRSFHTHVLGTYQSTECRWITAENCECGDQIGFYPEIHPLCIC